MFILFTNANNFCLENNLDKPKVELSEVLVHGPIGGDIEVICKVDASPRATITWHFSNNSQLNNADKHRIRLVPVEGLISFFMRLTNYKLS